MQIESVKSCTCRCSIRRVSIQLAMVPARMTASPELLPRPISRRSARNPDTAAESAADEAQLLRASVDAEVVMGSRYAGKRHFLAVEERASNSRGRHHVAMVRMRPRSARPRTRARRRIPLCVEGAGLVDLDGDHTLGPRRQRSRPRGALAFGLWNRGLRRLRLRHDIRRRVLGRGVPESIAVNKWRSRR